MKARRCRHAASILLGLQLSGCASWQTSTEAAPQLIARDQPSQIRILRTTGELTVIPNPTVREGAVVAGDSLTSRLVVPLGDIRRVEVRRVSGSRTTLLILGIISAGVIAIKAYARSISS